MPQRCLKAEQGQILFPRLKCFLLPAHVQHSAGCFMMAGRDLPERDRPGSLGVQTPPFCCPEKEKAHKKKSLFLFTHFLRGDSHCMAITSCSIPPGADTGMGRRAGGSDAGRWHSFSPGRCGCTVLTCIPAPSPPWALTRFSFICHICFQIAEA